MLLKVNAAFTGSQNMICPRFISTFSKGIFSDNGSRIYSASQHWRPLSLVVINRAMFVEESKSDKEMNVSGNLALAAL